MLSPVASLGRRGLALAARRSAAAKASADLGEGRYPGAPGTKFTTGAPPSAGLGAAHRGADPGLAQPSTFRRRTA